MLRAIAILLLLLITSCQPKISKDRLVNLQIVRVVSGQTVEVTFNDKIERIRIIGIDVPQQGKAAAKSQLKQLLSSNKIQLESNLARDRYDRILAHLWQQDTLLSEELAKLGYATANTKYPNKYSDRIFHAQEYARILGYGIWEETRSK